MIWSNSETQSAAIWILRKDKGYWAQQAGDAWDATNSLDGDRDRSGVAVCDLAERVEDCLLRDVTAPYAVLRGLRWNAVRKVGVVEIADHILCECIDIPRYIRRVAPTVAPEPLMQPSRDGSPMCQSGSIASGGTNAHCTCDRCF